MKSIKKNIYYMGDFCSNTGPAIVNKNYKAYMKNKSYICKTNNKLIRVLHFMFYILKCKVLLISGLSKFHIKAARLAKRMKIKVVYLMHGYNKLEYELNEIPHNKRSLQNVENDILLISDKIICVSENFCNYMKKERKDLADKIDFVNNGIELEKLPTAKEKKINTLFKVISVGGGMKIKNNLAICKAINKIENVKVKFIVIGNLGEDGEKIKEYNFVEYYEHLSHSDVLKKMSESNLYIQNSYFETFGLAVIEAITMGCDILVSKGIGALSIIDNINEYNIIENNEDIEDIKNKIVGIIKADKKNIYITDLNKYSWEQGAKKLLRKVECVYTREEG